MKITNNTTTNQVAELMGSDATERQGRIMMGLISRECIVDTEEVSDEDWGKLLEEVLLIEREESIDCELEESYL